MNKEEIEKATSDFDGGWWNYRLIEKTEKWTYKGEEHTEKSYDMHEVYYDKNGKPIAWSENPVRIYFSEYNDIADLIRKIKRTKRLTILKLVKKKNKELLIDTNKTFKQLMKQNSYGLSFTSTHFEEFDESK